MIDINSFSCQVISWMQFLRIAYDCQNCVSSAESFVKDSCTNKARCSQNRNFHVFLHNG